MNLRSALLAVGLPFLPGAPGVLLGTVPAPWLDQDVGAVAAAGSAFAIFYTGAIGSGALAPVLFGFMGDSLGVGWATVATAGTALATLPLAVVLSRRF